MKLSEVHNCEKCQGKIVCATIDDFGITRCAYCNEIVDYSNKKEKEKNHNGNV